MSLFPSASNQSGSKQNTASGSKDWVKNSSFTAEALLALQSHEISIEDPYVIIDTSDDELACGSLKCNDTESDDSLPTSTDPKLLEDVKLDIKTSSDGENEISIDKNGNKNNLYFSRPYKVRIPKFRRRSTMCLGLPKHLHMVFKEDKIKKMHKDTIERYFHLHHIVKDEDIQKEDVYNSSKIEQLNTATRERPGDVEVWVQLVDFQDRLQSKNVKLLTERKVAILEKAISFNTRSVELKLKRLELLVSISEDSDRDWKNLVFQHPLSEEAWTAYIDHTMAGRAGFTVNRTLAAFAKCVRSLSSAARNNGDDEQQAVERTLVRTMARLVRFLLEAGLVERCVLMLQLMVEGNCSVGMSRRDCNLVDDLERFHASGERLLGETGAQGIGAWSGKDARGGWVMESDDSNCVDDDDLDVDAEMSIGENWLRAEGDRTARHFLPVRSRVKPDDPNRVVEFAEVKGLLFEVKNDELRFELVRLLLLALGADPTTGDDHVLHLTHPSCQLVHPCHCSGHFYQTSPVQLTCAATNCPLLRMPDAACHDTVVRVFDFLCGIPDVAPMIRHHAAALRLDYHLSRVMAAGLRAGDRKREAKEGRRAARALLRLASDDADLWWRLAVIEKAAGKGDETARIVKNALARLPDSTLALCRRFAMLELRDQPDEVRCVLTALGDGKRFSELLEKSGVVTGVAMLRAKAWMVRTCEELTCVYQEMARGGSGREASALADVVVCCYAMQAVTASVTPPREIQSAIQVISASHADGSRQARTDLKLIRRVEIELYDCSHRSYRDAVLRALDDFPSCPDFALRLCHVDIGGAIDSVARRHFAPMRDAVAVHFAVHFELARRSRDDNRSCGDIPPRVINLLERALSRPHLQRSVPIWRILARLHRDPDAVLTRARAACPWSKAIACDAVRCRPADAVGAVVASMRDAGVRVRTPIEEIELLLSI